MRKWHIKYTEQAGADLGFFVEQHPEIWGEIKRIVLLLADEDDPRHPQNAALNVKQIEHAAPGWWRVVIGEPGPLWVRVVFTLTATRSNQKTSIELRDRVDEFDDPKYLEITYVSFRKDAYGKRLRDRFKRYGKN